MGRELSCVREFAGMTMYSVALLLPLLQLTDGEIQCRVNLSKDLHRFSTNHNNFLKIRNIQLANNEENCNLPIVLPNGEQVNFPISPGVNSFNHTTESAYITLQDLAT